MFHIYFHCIGADDLHLDRQGVEVLSLSQARDHAIAVARSIMDGAFGVEDFSDWLVYVADDEDEEVMLVPFTSALPTLH